MITLYGNYPTLESLTFDLRRMLTAIGWRVVRELTTGEGERLERRLWIESEGIANGPLL